MFKKSKKNSHGIIYAIFCYIMWGLFALYWHLLADISSLIILSSRIIWSAVFLSIFCFLKYKINFTFIIKNKKNVFFMLISGIIITINWGTYIFSVNNGYVVESSLGYYINPLVNVLLGDFF